MNENPFDETTLSPATSPMSTLAASSGEGVEVRYGVAQRVVVPAALALSGVIMPLILFFVLQPPLNFLMALVTAMTECSIAALMWFAFNSAFVRADANGITKSQLGKTQTVRWEDIASYETRQLPKGPTLIILKNAAGETVMSASDLNNPFIGGLLLTYIEGKLQK